MTDGNLFDRHGRRIQRQVDVGAWWKRHSPARKILLIVGTVGVIGLSLYLLFPRQHPQADDSATAGVVKASMQHTFDSDPRFVPYRVVVVTVSLAKQTGGHFQGVATVQTPGNSAHKVAIDVTDDGKNVVWHAEPGAFDWLKSEAPAR